MLPDELELDKAFYNYL